MLLEIVGAHSGNRFGRYFGAAVTRIGEAVRACWRVYRGARETCGEPKKHFPNQSLSVGVLADPDRG